MTTVISDNVHNFAVEGTSDELDIPIKKIFADWEYKNKHNLCSINSLNWARVLIQVGNYKNLLTSTSLIELQLGCECYLLHAFSDGALHLLLLPGVRRQAGQDGGRVYGPHGCLRKYHRQIFNITLIHKYFER